MTKLQEKCPACGSAILCVGVIRPKDRRRKLRWLYLPCKCGGKGLKHLVAKILAKRAAPQRI